MIFNSLVSHVNLTYNTYIVSNCEGGGQAIINMIAEKVLSLFLSLNIDEYLRFLDFLCEVVIY